MVSYRKRLSIEAFEERTCLTTIEFISHSPTLPTSNVVIDVDSDGHLDLVGYDSGSRSWLWRRNPGDGTGFMSAPLGVVGAGGDARSVKALDVDSDGNQDLVFGRDTSIRWSKNLGEGEFGRPETIVVGEDLFFDLGDLDQDGDLDIAVVGSETSLWWHENLDGAGEFSRKEFISLLAHPALASVQDLDIGDLDGDEKLDIVAALRSKDGQVASKVVWYPNLGAGLFALQEAVEPCPSGCLLPLSVAVGDIDGDGDEDVGVATLGSIRWNENLGNGFFDEGQEIASYSAIGGSLELLDLENDGDLDVVAVVSDTGSEFIWQENLGAGAFGEAKSVKSEWEADSFSYGDIDSDGDVDVVDAFGALFESLAVTPLEPLVGDLDFDGTVNFLEMVT